MRDRMMVPLEVDGLTAVALLDTGAQASLLGQSAARRLGLDERRLAEDPVLRMRGVGSGTTDARIHTFRQVRLGPISAQGMRLAVMPTDVGFGEALVGQDLLHGRRVWLSFPTRRVWVSERPGERLARP
jgi:predicted aspartyl protease